ncbi:MAG: queuosine precursor transporter [Acidaminococcaceae bacterium]
MSNESLLILNILIIYGGILVFYKLFGHAGLLCWTVFATIAANIEVMILINAFSLEQTLGNVVFASTFIVTDILSEVSGKKKANEAVNMGVMVSAMFIVVSQLWLLYTPSANDHIFPHIQAVFSNTPRMMISGLVVYSIVQRFDVWLYHHLWSLTAKYTGNPHSYLWLRNNAATLISQALNAVLFTYGAFYGTYDNATLVDIILTSYCVFIVTSLADTPVLYWARKIKPLTND